MKIIAEIGINHDGLKTKAKELIDASFNSGAHAIKFQYRNLDNSYSDNAKEIGDEMLSQEIIRNYLSPATIVELTNYAKNIGLEVGISFFDGSDIKDFGDNIAIFDFFKTPSVELANMALINSLLEFGKHLYISLGAHNEDEITNILSKVPKNGWTPMHCVSNYPLLLQNANLGYITYLQKKWNRDVGYSSHDDNWEVCLIAMSMGVKVIERHITLDRNDNGLDHSSSSTPDHFVKMSYFAKNMPKLLLGNTPKTINQGELLNRQNLGRSYYAKNNLFPGSLLQLENLDYKSPKTGIDKTNIDKYINKPIRINISKGDVITTSAFDGSNNISEAVIETARLMQLSLPIRFHDMKAIEEMFPISSFEFHLSFGEILSDIDISSINKNNQYSIHLPDYINPTQLIDPFSQDEKQKKDSVFLLDKTLMFARQLQDITKKKVVVVGSFSLVHTNRKDFFEQYKVLFNDYYNKYNIEILSQWLPPIAWYFGGSINLGVMNNSVDIEYIIENNINICMDVCHLIMGRNYYNFSATTLVDDLSANIKHLHIADALGIDGEGMEIGSGGEKNLQLISKALQYDCIKVIEVWQGHMNNYNGFKKALITLTNMYGK